MAKIKQLDPHVADLIAAGEVVERPASVVKELVENSIDAGASSVTVEIQNGGMTLIRVTDNGCGIEPEDAPVAFLRHATSKLRTERDLEAIGTLGFRGEALAAIAAVSRITLITRIPGTALGASLSLEGGKLMDQEEAGCPEGTTLVVRDLFYNTPARLKFIKRDVYEGAAVLSAIQRLALSHPEVSIRFLRDGKEELLTAGDGELRTAMYSVLGRDMALGFIHVNAAGEPIGVTGFISLPVCCRGTRGYQHFFVNGRYVKSRVMQAALEEAYQNQKMVGKFPGCVLHVHTRPGNVDVNVHPTKTEVKFSSEKQLFDAVYYAVLSTLTRETSRPAAVLPSAAAASVKQDTAESHQTVLVFHDPMHPQTAADAYFSPAAAGRQAARPISPRQSNPPHGYPKGADDARHAAPTAEAEHIITELNRELCSNKEYGDSIYSPEKMAAPVPAREANPAPPPAGVAPEPWRMLGEAFSTYIIVEQGNKILLIDKHAAHERMNFDRLRASNYSPMSQQLLVPAVFTPPAEEGAALLGQLPLLEEFGFEVEDFGGGAFLVRRAPGDLAAREIVPALTQLASSLLSTGTADPGAARDALLRSMACKAAIKGGQKNDESELMKVAAAVMEGGVKYCPHGRPVAIEITKAQLEKQIKRT